VSERVKRPVLLVEDNEDDELLTIDALRSSGVANDVFVVRDGEEALDWLLGIGKYENSDRNVHPDLVLLDLKLPKVSGFEILVQARKHAKTRYIPIVVLSSSSREEDIVISYKSGANSYIRKAMDFSEYSEAMRCLCQYWLQYNETGERG
jgi:two-component system, response regulator